MTRISNNAFSKDDIGLRQARLALIEHNAAEIKTLLGLTTQELQTWISTCHTQYDALVLAADARRNENEGKNEAGDIALTQLKEQLAVCKQYISSFYADDPERRMEYGVEGDLPNKANEILRIAKNVRDTAGVHAADNIEYVLPEDSKNRLAQCINAYVSATTVQSDTKEAKDKSRAAEQKRFGEDSKKLRKLLSLWLSRIAKDDERIALMGMVVPSSRGRRGVPGIPSLQLGITGESIIILPDAQRPEATSYQSEFRQADGGWDWEAYATNESTEILLSDPRLSSGIAYEFQVRARNARGYGEWSQILRIPARP